MKEYQATAIKKIAMIVIEYRNGSIYHLDQIDHEEYLDQFEGKASEFEKRHTYGGKLHVLKTCDGGPDYAFRIN